MDGKCVSCLKQSDAYIVHKVMHKVFPFCTDCINKGLYNIKIFIPIRGTSYCYHCNKDTRIDVFEHKMSCGTASTGRHKYDGIKTVCSKCGKEVHIKEIDSINRNNEKAVLAKL